MYGAMKACWHFRIWCFRAQRIASTLCASISLYIHMLAGLPNIWKALNIMKSLLLLAYFPPATFPLSDFDLHAAKIVLHCPMTMEVDTEDAHWK